MFQPNDENEGKKGKLMTSALFDLRQLQIGDAPALVDFYNALSPASIRTFRPLREKTTLPVCEAIVQANHSDNRSRLDWAAWRDGAIVGWVFLYQLDSAQPELGLGVADALQGQGVGRALLDQLLLLAADRAVPTIYLIVVNDNQRAIHLYRSRGFVTYDEQDDALDQVTYFYMKKELA